MAQQTAVEWLIENLMKLDKELDGRRKNEDATVLKLNPTKIFERAKQMEEEQHGNTWFDSRIECKGDDFIGKEKTFKEYYNETFGDKQITKQ
jgi:hypothetical protein